MNRLEAQRLSRFTVMLTESEDQAIQDFRFANRIGTKADAARQLIELGLSAAKEKGPAAGGTAPSPGHQQSRCME